LAELRAASTIARLLLSLLILAATPAAAESAPTIAAALRAPGPVLVIHADESHAALADKVADELGPLRGSRPERLALDDLDQVRWEGAHLVVLADSLDHPWLVAATASLDAAIDGDGLRLAGVELHGADAAAAVLLARDDEPRRWTLLLLGTGPAGLIRLDRAIRNDVAAPMLSVDDSGERLSELQRVGDDWRAPPGHPYRPDEVRGEFERWRDASRARVSRWDLAVSVSPEPAALRVEATVELERRRRGGAALWLQLNPRAELAGCFAAGRPVDWRVHDARDGRLLVRLDAPAGTERLVLEYRLPLDGRIDAWYLGPARGHVMPEANWVPRVRGEADEAYRARAPHTLSLDAAGGGVHVGGDEQGRRTVDRPAAPLLLWGDYRTVAAPDGGEAWLAPGAPPEVELRAAQVLEALAGQLPPGSGRARRVVVTDRPTPWYGDGTLLATPDLLEPGTVDELDRWLLARVVTEESVRIGGSPPGTRKVTGIAAPVVAGATARLWRPRGSWWQQVDEGPVDGAGGFVLADRGRGARLITVDAPGYVPGASRLAASGEEPPPVIVLEPVAGAALVCFRCGPDQRPERFDLIRVDGGGRGVTLAMGELHRAYGSFPYAFEVVGDSGRRVRVLDPDGPLGQFPSFLTPEEFHAAVVEFRLAEGLLRYWIEVPDALLLREGWIDDPSLSPAAPPP
jgi:hypothetical protein